MQSKIRLPANWSGRDYNVPDTTTPRLPGNPLESSQNCRESTILTLRVTWSVVLPVDWKQRLHQVTRSVSEGETDRVTLKETLADAAGTWSVVRPVFRPAASLSSERQRLREFATINEIANGHFSRKLIMVLSPRWKLSLVLVCVVVASSLGACLLASAQDERLDVPEIQRAADGTVTLSTTTKGGVIRYTLDGSDPVQRSGPYLAPIALAQGGTVKARTFTEDRKQKSDAVETTFEALPGSKPLPSTLVTCTQDRDWPVYDWAKRHAAVSEIVRQQQAELVFLGDSITQMFGGPPHDRGQPGKAVWEKYYVPRNAANLGFGYDYLENTLWRLQHGELAGAKARVVVIHIGTNNLGKNTPEEIAAGIGAICSEVHQQQPQAKILLLAILPRGARPDGMRTKLQDVNQRIAKLDGRNGITFLDVGAGFLQPDGSIPRELMGDFLHPTAKGYEIWAEAMEPTLARLLGKE